MVGITKRYSDIGMDAGFIVSEDNGRRSREQAIIAILGADAKAGTVLGRALYATPVSAAKAGGNTGNGTLTVDATTPLQPGVKQGIYTVRFTAATTYVVEDPDGNVIGNGANGAAFTDDIKFQTAAGGTPFVAGDGFDITVAAGVGTYAPLNLASINGGQTAIAILYHRAPTSAATQRRTIMARGCEVNGNLLLWPAGITDDQKKAAEAQLATKGIIVRY